MTKRYIVTAAQYNAPINRRFLSSLEQLASDRSAEIIILSNRERIKDDIFPSGLEEMVVLEENKRLRLNKNLQVDNYPIRPQQIDPITGLGRFVQRNMSAIFASPKQRLKMIPNAISDLPKILMTTGAVTLPSYRPGLRISSIAQRDHVNGAIYLEVENNKVFHFRQLTSNSRGEFADLGWRYKPHQEPTPSVLEALVLGDVHIGDHDPKVLSATYDLITTLQPKRVVLHDLFNGHSVNHHTKDRLVSQARDYFQGRKSLDEELSQVYSFLKEFSERTNGAEIIVVACNHHDFLKKYLEDKTFIHEPVNLYVASKILPRVIEGQDPVKAGLELFGPLPTNTKFLSRHEDYKVLGWQLGVHGDKGPNGAWKAGINAIEAAYGKSITGHKHTPEILRNTFVVGTSTFLNLDYTAGPSSWLNTHGVLYDTGRAQLINIINHSWKAKE